MAANSSALAQTPPVETITYTYDELGRLRTVTHAGTVNNGVNASYSYDKAGNRANVTVATSAPPAAPSFAIGNAEATEGSILSFPVTRTGTATGAYTLSYATTNGTAVAPTNYGAVTNGTISFASGQTSASATVTTVDDAVANTARTMSVTIFGASGGATITAATGTGTIDDNDSGTPTPPSFSIGSAQVTEGGTLSFPITRSGTTTGAYTMSYSTANGSAVAPGDFTAVANGTVSFAAGQTIAYAPVVTIDDTTYEPTPETMSVTISGVSGGGTISNATATGTINDNDSAPATYNINLASGGGTNLRSVANSNGYTGAANVTYNFTVPSGVTITGSPGGGSGIDTGTWPSGVTLTLNVSGTVRGGGGNGGNGFSGASAGMGTYGGDAITCSAPISISVSGTVQGGGGGGGGGGGMTSGGTTTNGGGGGGGGAPNGNGGAGGAGTYPGGAGQPGTTSGGGAGGTHVSSPSGGSGGTYATAGSQGASGGVGGGIGGNAGYAVRTYGQCTVSGSVTGTVG